MLLRKYICRRLHEYYSQPAHKVVGSTDASINFSSLWGQWHWKRTYKQLYKQQKGMWLTPVELFAPYYSNAFANFVSTSMKPMLESKKPFQIVELGGGRGTNAKALLNHLQLHHNEVYDKLREYTIFDTSPSLHELQRENLKTNSDHADKINLVNVDMMEIAEGTSTFLSHSDIPTTLIALELLDNFPHDKVANCFETNEILQTELIPVDDDCTTSDVSSEAIVDTSKQYYEVFSPVSDPLLQHILSIDPSLSKQLVSNGPRWIPSVALGVLMRLFECRPNSAVAFADFDWLPPPDLTSPEKQNFMLAEPAIGDPIVTDMKGIDHPCYLTTPPDELCDILYPTDFQRMASFTKGILRRDSESRALPLSVAAMKQNDFSIHYGLEEVNKTKSWTGYSPLIDDFGNCSVLTVSPHHLCK